MVKQVRNISFSSNTYLLYNEKKECIIIDPGTDYQLIDQEIISLNLSPIYVLATHGHFDHISSVAFFQKKYKTKFCIHSLDKKLLKSVNFFRKIMKIEGRIDIPVPDYLIEKDYEILYLNDFEIKSYRFPGHTKGSCLLKWNNNLFTGDTLYARGLGFNGFPGENKKILKASLIEILNTFEEDFIVYPGHGIQDSLNNIKRINTELNHFIVSYIDG